MEMQALQSGMMSIIPAYIAGNWSEIEATAGKMKSSYILKQSLTEAQVEELHSTLPGEFIKQDQRFHYLAGMLEHAAKHKKAELVNFYFSEMTESCVSCHSAFATHKFPALAPKMNGGHTHQKSSRGAHSSRYRIRNSGGYITATAEFRTFRG